MKALLFSNQRSAGQPASEQLPGLAHLQLTDVPVPDLPNENWAVIKSKIAGILGRGLSFLEGEPIPAAEPYFQLPVIPGHELFGEVEAVGKRVKGFHVGQRVSIDPSLGCRERGFKKLCVQCRNGNLGICEHLAEGCLKPGPLIGTCGDTGGGWGEYFVAPAHRLHPLPETICDDEASLIEPFAVCLRAVLNNPPQKKELVVVIGAGTIGLMNVTALKAVESACRVACVAKYPFQAKLARTLGAEFVIDAQKDDVMARVGELAQTKVHTLSHGGALLAGGVRVVYAAGEQCAAVRERVDLRLREFTDTRHHIILLRIDHEFGAECSRQLCLKRILGDTGNSTGRLYSLERRDVHQTNSAGANHDDEFFLLRWVVQYGT